MTEGKGGGVRERGAACRVCSGVGKGKAGREGYRGGYRRGEDTRGGKKNTTIIEGNT